ncbi:unnamed protein product [Nippostrongylus brasiliensis]|uniref:Torso-like protein n=1 Tax=Nippostrongylus brasiliensis TaxID=27835 RepID=A0A0N4XVM4_NIPBR|nr:unnamed protein product [Nippostrongylus brasiliensis]
MLPTTDIEPKNLLEKTVQNMNDPTTHQYSPETLKEFLRYYKSFMLSHILYHRGENVNIAVEDDYAVKTRPWYNNCVNRSYDMPPPSEWGKAWISENYDYMPFMESWHLDAGDTTHVMEDLDLELKLQARTYSERLMANELTYVLKYGNLLSGKWRPEILREMILRDEIPKIALSMLSAKAENSKFGEKSRDIDAAADTVREPLTEIDKNTNVIAADISGTGFLLLSS